MNFIYCGSCYDHYREKWPSLKKGFLIGAPLSLCAHLAARGLDTVLWLLSWLEGAER